MEEGRFISNIDSITHTSNPPIQLNSDSQTAPDLLPYEDTCRLNPVLSLGEVTDTSLDADHVLITVILESKETSWKSKRFSGLLKNFFDNNLAASHFFHALKNCIRRARDSQLILLDALRHFEVEEEIDSDRTLRDLKSFRQAGDPFTYEVFAFYHSVLKQQTLLLEALQAEVPVGSVKKWLKSVWKRGQREIVESMRVGTYVAIYDLMSIWVLVDKLTILMESLMWMADIEIALDIAVVLGDIKKTLDEYVQMIEDLSQHTNRFGRDISKTKDVVWKKIINHGS